MVTLRVATNPVQLQVDEAQIVFAVRNVRPQPQDLVSGRRYARDRIGVASVLFIVPWKGCSDILRGSS